jgi:protein-disulfide isomerase
MSTSKREEVKAQRQRRKRQERKNTFLIIGVVILIVVAILVYPSIVNALTPVGEVTTITKMERPLVTGRTMGDPNAPVKVEVFEDFQCPRCKDYSDTVEKSLVESDYIVSGQVYYIFRHYPFIDQNVAGKESHQAASASMCAAEQESFWDYHDMLFVNWNGENQGAFIDKRLSAFAESLGLNMEQFNSCLKENKYEDEINSDYDLGLRLGVQGTPTVFVNESAVTPGYVPSYEDIQQAIEAALTGGG